MMKQNAPSTVIQALDDASVVDLVRTPAPRVGDSTRISLEADAWEIARGQESAACLDLRFRCLATSGKPVAVGVEFAFEAWSTDCYVLIPGAVYAGNRFASRKLPYAPRLPEAETSPDSQTTIADIHRLEIGEGTSRIFLLAGDMAMPACAVFNPASQSARVILAREAVTPFGPLGFDFSESPDRATASLQIMVPGIRETRYEFAAGRIETGVASPDRGRIFAAGDKVVLSLEVHDFPCASPQGLFDKLVELRQSFVSTPPLSLPLSAAAELVKEHYNRTMWWPEAGLYRVWPLEGNNPYQTGWCGGIIAEYALLALNDDELTRSRCQTHLDKALTAGVSPSGLLYGKFTPELKWESDCWADEFSHPWRRQFTLTRRHGDALFYALKACAILRDQGREVPPHWLAACRSMADALCRTWEKQGQWGQFLDQLTGDVRLGNSASGALIPAALAGAFRWFDVPQYRNVAIAGGEYLYQHFTAIGVTTGGPGDALQAPDSESSYALVESYWALHALTGERLWLERAGEAARQFASWVMPYDYPFPEGSEFHRLDIRTAGTIFANAQNSHAAAICTHSGLALFELFRATGDRTCIDLLASITCAIPQLVSRDDRPIIAQDGRPLPPGWINERINTSDWDNNVGGVFYGPTWCEVALLLTAAEIPSIYARPSDGLLVVLDNLRAEWSDKTHTALLIENPTDFHATVRIFADLNPIPAPPGGDLRKHLHTLEIAANTRSIFHA